MLTELHIHNFAIIDKLDLRFGPGLIILTGETGAGKSIILDAVVMLIGGKADTTFVRTDSDAAFVEGVFHLKCPEKEAVHAILQREELMDDPNYVVLMREIRKEGRSVARVNGRTVNVSLLRSKMAEDRGARRRSHHRERTDKLRNQALAAGIKQSLTSEFLLQLFERDLKRPDAFQFDAFNKQLILASRFIDS